MGFLNDAISIALKTMVSMTWKGSMVRRLFWGTFVFCQLPSMSLAENSPSKIPTETTLPVEWEGVEPKGLALEQGIYIKVGDAAIKRSLLAMPTFQYVGTATATDHKGVGFDIYNTALNDLEVSSYFEFIKQEAFLEDVTKVGLKPAPGDPKGFNFDNWKKIGTDFLIRAAYRVLQGEVVLEVYLYQVSQAKLIMGKEYTAKTADARSVGHHLANDVVKSLTGKPGIFLSKVVVSSDRDGNDWKEIYTMDWDFQNIKKISNHKSITLSPNWSPDGKSVVYTAYAFHQKTKTRNADLFSYEIDTGKRFLISSKKGINSGACFSPDGKTVYLTVSQEGNPDIFSMNSNGEKLSRITNGPLGAMNVEPAVSPDGKKITFSSDRSGRPMIYVMNTDGQGTKRLTFAGKYNASPGWSPDGKKITFAGYDKDHFDVFVMNADGTNIERLTSAKKKNGKPSNNEDPAFSPDGRHVMFISDRTGSKQIYIVNVNGSNERRLTTDSHNYFRPKWSWASN